MRTLLLTLFTSLLSLSGFSFSLQLTVWNETCGNANGAITVAVNGNTGPYTFAWSTSATTDHIKDLVPGWYTVTVTDDLGEAVVDSAEVVAVPNLEWPGTQNVPQAGLFGCGGCNAGFHISTDPETLGWYNINGFASFDPAPFDVAEYGSLFGPYCLDIPIELTVTDSTGCAGTVTINGLYGSTAGPMTLVGVEPACNGANGSITVDPMGGGFILDQFSVVVYDNTWTVLAQCNSGFCAVPTYTFTNLPSGMLAVVRTEQYYDPYGMSCAPETLYVNVPDLGPTCGHITGTVYIDNDQDCVQDVAEVGAPYSVLEIAPGPEYAITDGAGHYARGLLNGNYTLTQTDPTLIPICPLPQPVPVTINSAQVVIDLADSSTAPLDLAVYATGSAARPGFATTHAVLARNLSPQVSGPVTITYVYDPVLVYVSASVAPTSITGNTLTWEFTEFTAYTYLSIYLQFDVPVGTALGALLGSTFSATNTLNEATLANNTTVLTQIVTGSVDPNDKTARTSSGSSDTEYFIDTDEWLDYTIRFQNTGTDTAFTVVVTDVLDEALDMAAYEQGAASHPFSVAFKPGRVVEWRFENILLPDSGTNEAASHGLVQFRIKPVALLLPGTVISNAADIYFDFNAPVHTNDAVLTAQISTHTPEREQAELMLFPNPANDHVIITMPDGMLSIELLSTDGRVVRTQRATGRSITMDISALPNGPYILRVRGHDGHVRTALLTKQ